MGKDNKKDTGSNKILEYLSFIQSQIIQVHKIHREEPQSPKISYQLQSLIGLTSELYQQFKQHEHKMITLEKSYETLIMELKVYESKKQSIALQEEMRLREKYEKKYNELQLKIESMNRYIQQIEGQEQEEDAKELGALGKVLGYKRIRGYIYQFLDLKDLLKVSMLNRGAHLDFQKFFFREYLQIVYQKWVIPLKKGHRELISQVEDQPYHLKYFAIKYLHFKQSPLNFLKKYCNRAQLDNFQNIQSKYSTVESYEHNLTETASVYDYMSYLCIKKHQQKQLEKKSKIMKDLQFLQEITKKLSAQIIGIYQLLGLCYEFVLQKAIKQNRVAFHN